MNDIQCSNLLCKKAPGGNPAFFNPVRKHHIYCCQSCRVEAWNDRRAGGAKVVELDKRVAELEGKVIALELIIEELKEKISITSTYSGVL
jgi:predicted metal-binding protein